MCATEVIFTHSRISTEFRMFSSTTFLLLTLLYFVADTFASSGHEWTYSHTGNHEDWHSGQCESNDRQSPLKLITPHVCHSYLKKIVVKNSHHKFALEAVNNGHALLFQAAPDNDLSKVHVELYNSDDTTHSGNITMYQLQSFHFHWKGTDDAPQGSEHSLDGNFYDSEMHLVFTDADDTDHVKDRYAVLGFLIKADRPEENPDFHKLFGIGLQSIAKEEKKILDEKVCIHDLIGSVNMNKYLRYEGSLTTPPCSETVKWTVFTDVLHISRSQLEQLRSLPEVGNLNNYREPYDPAINSKLKASC